MLSPNGASGSSFSGSINPSITISADAGTSRSIVAAFAVSIGAPASAPASAEIVIEGLIDPEKLEPEAPFGESNGYVALEAYNMPMRLTAITHKRAPVFTSIISQVTPSESSVVK